MRMTKKFLPLFLIPWVFTACETSKITNLTPARMERSSTGVYPIEAAWETMEHAFRPDSLKPQVMVGSNAHPMTQVPVVKNRYEAMISIPESEKTIRYRFKFDYEYNSIPVPRPNSKMSPEYKLEIIDKK
jgi:hypothetical protein